MQLKGLSPGRVTEIGATLVERLRHRSSAFAAVGAAAVLIAAFMVAQSSPRSELDVHLSDGAVWLPSTAIGGISLLDGGSGTIAASLGVANPGDDFSVEQFGSDAVIVNRTAGTVARLDGASWTIATGRVQFGTPGEPLHVVTNDETGWIMTPGQATTLELEELTARTPVPVAAPFADGIITREGALLYASSDPELTVQKFMPGQEPEALAELDGPTALIDLGSTVAGIDLDDRSVWIEGRGVVCKELEFPADAVLHAGGGEGHLIVVSDQGGAFVWDATDAGCPGASDFINLGPGTYGEPALTDGWAVVPETATSSVLVIDLDDMSVTNRQELDGVEAGTEVSLIAEDGSIWYNDPRSARAGLIRRDGTIIPIAKYEDGATGFTAAPVDDAADDAEDVSIAGAQPDQQPSQQAPEAESVAGPELTTTTVAGSSDAGNDAGADQSGTTTPSTTEPEGGGNETPATDDTSDTTDGGGETEGTTDTTDGGEGPSEETSTTSTTEQPEDEGVVISMGVSALSVTAGETINFTAITQHGSPNNWGLPEISPAGPQILPIEDFGSFRILFPDPGDFTVAITACDADDNCDTARATVTIVADPAAIPLVAAIEGPSTVVVGDTAAFRDISQGEPDSWNWSAAGGSPSTGTGDTIDVSWDFPGPKIVTLTVGRGGTTRTATTTVDVVAAPVPAPFGLLCLPSTVDIGVSVNCQLDGDAGDFSGITFSTSADGAVGFTSSTPSAGRFTMSSSQERTVNVTLQATDDGTGDTVTDTASVTFQAPICAAVLPTVTVTGPSTLTTGQTGTFTGDPSDGCGSVSRSWSATGGGSIASPGAASTSISWAAPGTYTVTYDFADGGGPGSASMQVTVSDPAPGDPAPSISINGSSSLDTGVAGSFSASNSGGPIDSYSWSTNGGGGSGSSDTFSASWNTAGSYTVTLNVSGPGGSDTATYSVSVADPVVPPSPFGMTCDVASAVVDAIFSCDLTTGDPADFSNPSWSVGPASALSWQMSEWSYDAAGTVVGSTVTVSLSATDLATGQTVSASDSVSITAPPVPALGLTCSPTTRPADGTTATTCSITNAGEFSSVSFASSQPGANQWGAPGQYFVAWDQVGTINITASATHTATGTPVSAGPITITYEAVAPTPAPFSMGCTVSTASVGQRFNCSLTSGNAAAFSGLSWAVSGVASQRWGGGGSLDVQGDAPGTLTIQLSGTDIATGTPVSGSANVTIN